MSKTILLTGSGGFIGKNLKEFFQNDMNLLTPRSFELDLCDENAVKKYFNDNEIDFVINCSSKGGAREIEDENCVECDNFSMVTNILKYKQQNTKMILFGSGAMYDKSRNLHKVKETEIGKFIPNDLYGKSKVKIAKLIKNNKDVLCLNIFGCYGKYEKNSRFPTYAISQNIFKKPIIINQNVIFDYIYIKDLQKIIKYFMENSWKNNILNLTPTKSISLLEISEIVNEISDFRSEIIIKNPVLNNEYTGDNTLLLKELGNFEFCDYKTGLKEFYFSLSGRS